MRTYFAEEIEDAEDWEVLADAFDAVLVVRSLVACRDEANEEGDALFDIGADDVAVFAAYNREEVLRIEADRLAVEIFGSDADVLLDRAVELGLFDRLGG